MRKTLTAILLGCALLFTGAAVPHENDIPSEVTTWADTNAWSIATKAGTGSGFFIDQDTLITACHVVHNNDIAYGVNHRDTQFLEFDVKYCNIDTDVAVLELSEFSERPKGVVTTEVLADTPDIGTAVWGTGYPLGGSLFITQGHIQEVYLRKEGINVHMASMPTIFGDSGSAAIVVEDGRVKIAGIRIAVSAARYGFSQYPVYHMTILATGHAIWQGLHDTAIMALIEQLTKSLSKD